MNFQCNNMWTKSLVHVTITLVMQLKQIHRLLRRDVTMRLVSAYVLSRLDYCNAVLAGLPKSTTVSLQRAQNVAACLVTGIVTDGLGAVWMRLTTDGRVVWWTDRCIGSGDHVTPALQQLHWLTVQYRITFKLCLLCSCTRYTLTSAILPDLPYWLTL